MQLIYDFEKRIIYLESNELGLVLINDNNPSSPVISPDNKFAVYISPYEWEEKSNLYLIDLSNGSNKKIYEPGIDNLVPKAVTWINSETLALILGYRFGTVEIGGNVYTLNIHTNAVKKITYFDSNIQITNLEMNEGILEISGIKYIDENFINKENYFDQIKEF